MRPRIFTAIILLGLLLPIFCIAAQKKKSAIDNRSLKAVSKSNGQRIALVIGNGDYRHTDTLPRLANPTNDADDIAAALRQFGFEVIEKKNQTKEQMDSVISNFGRRIVNTDAALFYYAGHGLQVKGQNYLIPVDARIESEAQIPYKSINVNQLLDEMDNSKSRVNIVILDACRNNTFGGEFRSGVTRGLAAPASMPKSTVIVYATGPGNVATDGSGRNGLFTAGLLTAFKGHDLTLGGVLTRASEEVENSSGQQQIPYINGPATVQKRFSFKPVKPSPKQSAEGQTHVGATSIPQPSPAKPAQKANFSDSTTGMEFVFVKGGCYEMGDTFGDGWASEKPSHNVCVNDLYVGKHEVTKGQFRIFAQATGYRTEAENNHGCRVFDGAQWKDVRTANWRDPGFKQDDSHPAVCITYSDALAFANWLSSSTSRHVRLPTEAEWEYAARSGGKRQKYAGGFNPEAVAWYTANSNSRTNSVGSKQANELGLFDMSGNVWEWCSDWYGEKYYTESHSHNPQGPPTGSDRVVRGGAWSNGPAGVRTSFRNGNPPVDRGGNLGFRLVFSSD